MTTRNEMLEQAKAYVQEADAEVFAATQDYVAHVDGLSDADQPLRNGIPLTPALRTAVVRLAYWQNVVAALSAPYEAEG